MAQAPFLNPIIPFVGPIQNGLKLNTLINIQGTSFPTSNRICFNLQIGPNVAPRDSVALHVAFDFTRNLIVRNSIQGHNWGVEEINGPPVALIRGQPFKLDILCDMYEYRIAFNGAHYTEMKHRIPFASVFYLAIDGEAQLHSIQINSGGSGPFGGPAMPLHGHPGSYSSGYIPTAGHTHMPGVPPGPVPPYSSGHNAYPGQTHNSPYLQKHTSSPIKDALNQGLINYAVTGHISPRKAAKAQRKQAKKALKYGVPMAGVAGVGTGAYAVHKAHKAHKHKGFKHKKKGSSSSSSSSSSSD